MSKAKEEKKSKSTINWERIITATLAIIIGVLFIALSKKFANVLCTVSGIMLMLLGVVAAVSSFTDNAMLGKYSLSLGIALALAGLLCIVQPWRVLSILCAIFGIFIVVDGALTLIDAIDCARAKIKEWYIILLISIASMTLGAVIMFVGSEALMWLAGLFLIIEGVIDIVIIALFGKRIKRAKRLVAQVVSVEDAGEASAAPADEAIEEAHAKTDEEIEKEIGELGRE